MWLGIHHSRKVHGMLEWSFKLRVCLSVVPNTASGGFEIRHSCVGFLLCLVLNSTFASQKVVCLRQTWHL